MTNNDEFELVLDDALAEYREAEPLAGLEDRVLHRLRLQTEHRRKIGWGWAAIGAVAAALAVAAWIGLGNRTRQQVVVQTQAPAVDSQTRTAQTRATSGQPTPKRLPGRQNAASQRGRMPAQAQLASIERAPMREQFPSPAPLKPEERILLALATTHPEILMDQPDGGKEIVIAPISIQPLVNVTGGDQGEN